MYRTRCEKSHKSTSSGKFLYKRAHSEDDELPGDECPVGKISKNIFFYLENEDKNARRKNHLFFKGKDNYTKELINMRAYNNSQGTHTGARAEPSFSTSCRALAQYLHRFVALSLAVFILRLKINISHRNNGSQLCIYPRLCYVVQRVILRCLSPFI